MTKFICAFAAGFLSLPFVAYAEPIQITSGHVRLDLVGSCTGGCDGPSEEVQFTLFGQGLSIQGLGAFDFSPAIHFRLADDVFEGNRIDLSSDLPFLGLLVDHTALLTGDFAFHATRTAGVTCQTTADGESQCAAASPFRFSGDLTVESFLPGGSTFTTQLTGSGVARFSSTPGVVDYTFSTAATPEPATALLLGVAVSVGAARRRRRIRIG